jgi:S-DNA-T family DNA segregation ATPase FtsK/SpoIIIE
MRNALGVGADTEDEPLILRRARPPETAAPALRARDVPFPIGEVEPAQAVPVTVDELESEETAHLAEVEHHEVADAALEATLRRWDLPEISLLDDAPASSAAQLDLTAKGQRIRETLAHFGIGVKVARIQEGPVVTQYALDVEPGIKLSRIEGLADNLALALAARSIRIQAPIPGEPFVGIEIPNTAFDLVTLKEVLASPNFETASAQSKLAFALGQDVAGQPFSADLARMPHVLISGATGSGKSVCVNAIVCSLLMRATPTEVKLIMIDPKRVEMAQYKGIPHLLTEVIVDTDRAVNALKWTVGTMESRYHEFAKRGVRNVASYNEALRAGEPRMPYIVVVIDELADLMMVSAYEVEATITRIAQLARATGIHLVIATQRPSVQVITGLIKANIPSRIAFAMTSGVDSRTILDTTGAEDLLGRGDMLYQPIDAPRAVRLQGVLVTDGEIDDVARHWRAQGGPQYRPEITAPKRDGKSGGRPGEGDGDDADPLLSQAIDIVRRSDKASASLLQRRLRVGYARAARILDQMEDRGIVGPAEGSRFREVLVTPDGWGGEIGPDEDEG